MNSNRPKTGFFSVRTRDSDIDFFMLDSEFVGGQVYNLDGSQS